jgi:AsmA protein
MAKLWVMTQAAPKSKFWLRLVGGAFLLLIVVVGAAFLLLDPERFRPLLVAEMERSLARKVSVGQLKVGLFPPSFAASKLEVGDDPAFSAQPFLVAAGLSVRPSLLPLLTGKVEIQSVSIQQPRIELISNQAGIWNYASLGGAKKADASQPPLQLARLLVEDATLGLKAKAAPREVYRHISLELRDYAGEGKPFFVRLAATMQNEAKIAAEGRIAIRGQRSTFSEASFALAGLKGSVEGHVEGEQLQLKVGIPKSPLAPMAPLFLPKGMKAEGDIAAAIDATGTLEAPQLKGRIEVTSFGVSGGDIKQPVRTAKMLLRLDPERISLEPAKVLSGSTQLQVFGVLSHYSKVPQIEATLLSEKAQLGELIGIARAYGVSAVEGISATGEARVQIRAHGPLKALQMMGSGAMSNAVLQLPSLTKPLEVKNVDFRFEQDSLSLTKLDARAGSAHPVGEVKIRNFRSPRVEFNLAIDQLNVEEMRALLKPAPAAAAEAAPRISAGGDLSIGTLQLDRLTLNQMRGKAEFADQRLVIEPLSAQIYGGTHAGRLSADLRAKVPVISLESRLVSIESSELLAAVTAVKGALSGPLSGALKLSLSPGSPEETARSLNGTITLKVDKGRLASFNLTNELSGVAKFLGFQASPDSFTQFQTLGGDLKIENGVASTDNFRMELGNLAANLSGTMNLADQTLNLKLLSTLDKKFSEQVGGSQVGGFMSVALSNARGEMLIPVSISGTFAKPRMSPDPAAMARLKLQQFSPSNPKQMIDNVNSVIDIFRKKKPQQ